MVLTGQSLAVTIGKQWPICALWPIQPVFTEMVV
jgi:hypothetical protein